jgi:hypothetical protein
LRILRLKAGPPPAPLTSSEKFNRALARSRATDARLARRITELKRGTR